MTFLDMAKQERNILNEEHLIQDMCPSDLGYEPKEKCKAIIGLEEKDKDYICRRCWEREMPNTNQKEDGILVIPQREIDSYNKGHEDGVAQGLNDAWELICKINKISTEESERVYGKRFQYITDIIENLTPQEALAKLKAYEDSKIEVGDVVENIVCGEVFVGAVSNVYYDVATVMWGDGTSGLMKKNELKKTGKHIDISSILEQIGE